MPARFDPGPLARVFRYDLAPADALAWERLPAEARGWHKVAVYAPWVALGLVWGGSGDMDSIPLRLALTGGVALAAMLLAGALTERARRRRALARVPRRCRMQCEDRGDHLLLHPIDPPGPAQAVPLHGIRQVVLARGHVFVDAPPALVILPLAAFDAQADMAAFATAWQQALQDDEAKADSGASEAV